MVAVIDRPVEGSIESPSSAFELITPDIAAAYLARNPRNRLIEKRIVRRYASAMRAGHWESTGQSIQFDTTGDLVDGQHRLTAIVETGLSFTMLVVRGLSPSVRDVIDTGKARTLADSLRLRGTADSPTVGGMLRWKYRYDRGLVFASSLDLDHRTLEAVLDENPSIGESASARTLLQPKQLIPPTLAGWLLFELHRADAGMAAQFFDQFAAGSGIAKGDVAYIVRQRLISDLNSRQSLSHQRQATLAVLIVKGWNAFAEGRSVSNFVVKPNQPFPVIWGAAPAHLGK
jgi:hypothetical protein